MVRGSPCMCISTTGQPSSAAVERLSGAKRKAVTSFHMSAPAASAARATLGFMVSIEMGISLSARMARISGATRAVSTSASTCDAPGRVDSPPMSSLAAPSAISRRALSNAAAGSL